MFIRKNKGFTFVEVMIAMAIMGLMTVAILKLYTSGITMWNSGRDNLRLSTEAKIAMAALTKFVQVANGTSICISRFDSTEPANSYISGTLTDTIYITSTTSVCCGGGSDYFTAGNAGDPVQIFQKDHYLLAVRPVPIPGASLTDNTIAHSRPQCITISANLDSLQFTYDDSTAGNTIVIGMRFSCLVYKNKPPISIFLKKTVVIKHQNGTGYYGN
jgi:prepilin-type N-terminal cleavage/methylation domain-containing protein